jgi:polar amino acid transport system substrate-binding protein
MGGNVRASVHVGAALVLAVGLPGCTDDEPGVGGSAAAAFEVVQEGVLTICSDVPNEPFQYEDPGSPDGYGGFEIDLARAVAEDLGLELEVVETSFDRIADASAMAAGRCDMGASAIVINEAWQATLDFSAPHYELRQSLLVPTGSDIASLEETAEARLGVQIGAPAQAYAEANAPDGAEIIAFATPGDLLVAVAAGDIDAVLQDSLLNAALAGTEDEVEVVDSFATGEHYGFAVEAGRDDGLLEAVQAALDALVEDGTFDELHDRAFGP